MGFGGRNNTRLHPLPTSPGSRPRLCMSRGGFLGRIHTKHPSFLRYQPVLLGILCMGGLGVGLESTPWRPVAGGRAVTITTAATTTTSKKLGNCICTSFRPPTPPESHCRPKATPSAAAARPWHTKPGQSTPIAFSASCHGPDDHRRRRGTMTPCEPRTSPTLEIPATLNLCPRAGQRCRCRHILPRSRDLPRTAFVPLYRSHRHDRRQDRQTSTNLFRLARRPPAGHRRGALRPSRSNNPPLPRSATLQNPHQHCCAPRIAARACAPPAHLRHVLPELDGRRARHAIRPHKRRDTAPPPAPASRRGGRLVLLARRQPRLVPGAPDARRLVAERPGPAL